MRPNLASVGTDKLMGDPMRLPLEYALALGLAFAVALLVGLLVPLVWPDAPLLVSAIITLFLVAALVKWAGWLR